MNQDPNNLNQNTFNTQGNSEFPNNQGLNNTFNNQQQVNPNNQQPVNQMNIQQPTAQPINSFSNGNVNQDFNSKPPKKKHLGLIVGIVVAVIVIIAAIFILNGNNKLENESNNNPNINENENKNDIGTINYKDVKVKVGNGNFIDLGTSIKEIEQTGMSILDGYSNFDEDYTLSSNTYDNNLRIKYNDSVLGKATINNPYSEPKTYKDCVITYLGFDSLPDDIKLYYLDKELSTRTEVLELLGNPHDKETNTLEEFYIYELPQTDFVLRNGDFKLMIGFEENNDKIVKFTIGSYYN